MERAVATGSLAEVARAARPVTLAREQLLPVAPPLAPLLPRPGLQRGTVVATQGPAATSLALALTAEASAAGSWVGVLGLGSLGLLAAAEAGLALERLLLVAAPEPAAWASVVATLLDGVDVVLAAPPRALRPADARRLQARARERGGVLIGVGGAGALDADIALTTVDVAWEGIEQGAGHLRGRRVVVEATGRRAAARPRRAALWLPGEDGGVAALDAEVLVMPLLERGAS